MEPLLRHRSALLALAAWCVALLGVRVWYSGSARNTFLLWNLLLAAIPFAAGMVLRQLGSRHGLAGLKLAVFAVWLAFLPNAPYLVTDLVHLRHYAPIPLWFEVALFGSYAATGVLLGFAAVSDVEAAVGEMWGRTPGTVVAVTSLLLSGYGIYLGRFLRWNSWDLLTSPSALLGEALRQLAHPLAYRTTWQVSAVYGLGLVLGYLALRGSAAPQRDSAPR